MSHWSRPGSSLRFGRDDNVGRCQPPGSRTTKVGDRTPCHPGSAAGAIRDATCLPARCSRTALLAEPGDRRMRHGRSKRPRCHTEGRTGAVLTSTTGVAATRLPAQPKGAVRESQREVAGPVPALRFGRDDKEGPHQPAGAMSGATPAEAVSTPGRAANTCSAVGERRRLRAQRKRRLVSLKYRRARRTRRSLRSHGDRADGPSAGDA